MGSNRRFAWIGGIAAAVGAACRLLLMLFDPEEQRKRALSKARTQYGKLLRQRDELERHVQTHPNDQRAGARLTDLNVRLMLLAKTIGELEHPD